MKIEEWKKKGIRGVKTIIYGRTLFVVLAFLIQFAFLAFGLVWLKRYSLIIYGLFLILGTIVVIHLFTGRETPEFKLVWMLPVVIFPVFGALFYLFIIMQPGAKKIY